jgi:hypothetical protein
LDKKKIYIDFQGGSHGNYLEFVCNRFLAGIKVANPLPFNKQSAAHTKQYLEDPIFKSNHYTTYGLALNNEILISIHIEPDDLLALQCTSLLRAGDRNIRPEALEVYTYHKLCNPDYQSVLHNLIDSFFNNKDMIAAYRAIADPSWPEISSIQEYLQLPEHIRRECEDIHDFTINTLNQENPHCPREILIEFFQIGFSEPTGHGFIKAQENHIHADCNIYTFPFACFYDEERFLDQMVDLSKFLYMPFDSHNEDLIYLHREFLRRQPYRDVKQRCDELVDQALQNPDWYMPELDVIQEAYVRAMLNKQKAP